MKMKLALLLGKILYLLGKPFGKSTNLPGELALKICPDMMGRFRFDGKVLAVTGSNGKTSTANMVAHILKKQGHTVAHNAKGSNLTGGVATTLLVASTMGGRVKQDFVVLEVDERFSRLIFRDFSPDYLLCTNLFRDQLTRNGNVDVIIEKLHEAIKPSVKLILNGNDPISGDLAPGNERVYYGLLKTAQSSEKCRNITHDAKVCPRCFGRMNYTYYHYNHIGGYACAKCGYTNPEWAYTADQVDFATGDFTINGCRVHTDYKDLFNILNTTAAVAACTELGLPLEACCEAISTFVALKQRYDEFRVGDRKAVMILSKNQNPVSFDQSITHVLEREGEKTVVVFINNINHTGHKDTTWLYDIGFERLLGKVDAIVGTGPRAYDLAVRLKLAGFPSEKVRIERDLSQLKPVIDKTRGDICILTELYDAKSILEVISK
ncbi:MAG: MurT ligase domain-containing protein [Oscillospiraceae bacterium]